MVAGPEATRPATTTSHKPPPARVWAGLGERVTIRIRESSPGVHLVALKSVSIVPWAPFDMGKNNKNLNTIVTILLR